MDATTDSLIQKIDSLDEETWRLVAQYIEALSYDDRESDDEVAKYKYEAYCLYAKNIANLIADVEVYTHDLPEWLYGYIETILQMLSAASECSEKDAIPFFDYIVRYEKFVINAINLYLIDCFIARAKKYKRILSRFNHITVLNEDHKTPILNDVKHSIKNASLLKKQGYKLFKDNYNIKKEQNYVRISLDNLPSNSSIIKPLADALSRAKTGVELCEKYYPNIINNGYVSSFAFRFVRTLPAIISFILALLGAITILRKIGLM